jgi:hypothetical protein
VRMQDFRSESRVQVALAAPCRAAATAPWRSRHAWPPTRHADPLAVLGVLHPTRHGRGLLQPPLRLLPLSGQ